ncbi:MAG TPA: hypothetical protein PK490_06265 [Prosthecobacter sp.]|nr:hypothetical protein [Prosthecobacter sp.]
MKRPLSPPARRAAAANVSAFDPAQPQDGALVVAGVLREQFNSLFALIQSIQSVNAAQVDSVGTLNPGQPATVSVTVTGQTLHFHFGIPRGLTGEQGPPGEVTGQELADGLETRAFAIPSVGTLDQSAEPEYSPTQAQDIINTLNALITALKGS